MDPVEFAKFCALEQARIEEQRRRQRTNELMSILRIGTAQAMISRSMARNPTN